MRLSELAKAAAPPKSDQEQVVRGKKKQKKLSELSAGLGLAAFGTQLPKVATLASRNRRVGRLRAVKRVAALAPKAQKASDAIVPASLGTGAIGSLNFARTTGREVKVQEQELAKGLPSYLRTVQAARGAGPAPKAVLTDTSIGPLMVTRANPRLNASRLSDLVPGDSPKDRATRGYMASRISANSRGRDRAQRKAGAVVEMPGTLQTNAGRQDRRRSRKMLGELETISRSKHGVAKRDDRFLRTYRRNISTGAENAYVDLGRRKRGKYVDAATYGGLAGAAGGWGGAVGIAARRAAQKGVPGGVAARRAAVMGSPAALAVPAAALAYRRFAEGRSLQGRRDKIKAKAHERARAGELGRDRSRREWEGVPQPGVSKAIRRMPRTRINPLKPRPGGVMRTASGKQVSYRGSIVGTGRYAAPWR